MTRRVRALLVAGVLFLVLFFVALFMPVPYVILGPGPTLNTLGKDNQGRQIIVIRGRDTNPTTGNLNLTTVGITPDRVTAVQALVGWLQSDRVVVPRAAYYPPGQTEEQVNQLDTQQFVDSQSSATAAAFCELGYPRGLGVVGILDKSGAQGVLKPFDEIISFDGQAIADQDALAKLLATKQPGQRATIVVSRAGVGKTVRIPLSKPQDNGTGARIGITVSPGCFAPFEVDLGLADQIGGPSAGLMFALGIIDKVGPTNLTNGRFIAGTGEISADGAVEPIGGIQLKMIAARRAGATIFLAPADNCKDVAGAIPKGLSVVKVSNLHQAVQDLSALEKGQTVAHC
jgi:PDZ domain-containing protein